MDAYYYYYYVRINIISVEERRTLDYLYSNIFLYRIKILLLFQVSDLKFATTTEKKRCSGMQNERTYVKVYKLYISIFVILSPPQKSGKLYTSLKRKFISRTFATFLTIRK